MIVKKIHPHHSCVGGADVAHTTLLQRCYQHRQFTVVHSGYGSTPSGFSHYSR
ncbi:MULTISPECIES: hypothetical protein [Prevotellaceae]|uniref:hypothetical protein n=1 Tax=Prevotellaceae TaxID=171552 RepID=UPI0012DC2DDC|nr:MULTISPECIES: hypothetical protein [Prevotellaceae]